MDAQRFDDLSRALARGAGATRAPHAAGTRRTFLKSFVGGAAAILAARTAAQGGVEAKDKDKDKKPDAGPQRPPGSRCSRDSQCAVGSTGFRACCNGTCCDSGVGGSDGDCIPCTSGLICNEVCCATGDSCGPIYDDPTLARACCPPDRTVPLSSGNSVCCRPGQVSMGGSIGPWGLCCAAEKKCGATCCLDHETCTDPATGTCCLTEQVCGDQCCPAGTTCCNGACRPDTEPCCAAGEETCGDECCGANEHCCNGTCIGSDLECCGEGQKLCLPGGFCCQEEQTCGANGCECGPDQTTCDDGWGGYTCCGSSEQCCNNACIPAAEECCEGVTCLGQCCAPDQLCGDEGCCTWCGTTCCPDGTQCCGGVCKPIGELCCQRGETACGDQCCGPNEYCGGLASDPNAPRFCCASPTINPCIDQCCPDDHRCCIGTIGGVYTSICCAPGLICNGGDGVHGPTCCEPDKIPYQGACLTPCEFCDARGDVCCFDDRGVMDCCGSDRVCTTEGCCRPEYVQNGTCLRPGF